MGQCMSESFAGAATSKKVSEVFKGKLRTDGYRAQKRSSICLLD